MGNRQPAGEPVRPYLEPLAITLLFFLIALATTWHHEMWRDEYQAWLIAKTSTGLLDLIHNCRYEGHPIVWHLLLFIISRFTDNPFFMQLAHVTIATTTVALINLSGPFSRWEKIAASFGYLLIYEYAVISRNYGLGVLGVITFCALMRAPARSLIAAAVTIFLLANTSVYGLALAGTCTLFLLASLSRRNGAFFLTDQPLPLRQGAAAAAIVLAGASLAILQIIPPADYSFPFLPYDLPALITAPLMAYLPIPQLGTVSFWNTSIFWSTTNWQAYWPLHLASFLLIFGIFAASFRRCGPALLFYLTSSGAILLLHYLTMRIAYRYSGFFFVALLASCWLFRDKAPQLARSPLERLSGIVLAGLLAVHLVVGGYALVMELRYPFSRTAEVGTYITGHQLTKLFTFGNDQSQASAVSAFTDRPVYFPESRRSAKFVVWNKQTNWDLNPYDTALDLVQQVTKHGQVLAIMSYSLDMLPEILRLQQIPIHINIEPLAQFDNKTISASESPFYLYLLSREAVTHD